MKMINKICSRCKKELSLREFSKNIRSKDKLDYVCRQCKSFRHSSNIERNNKKSLEYYYSHHEERKQKNKEWKLKNNERVTRYLKEYRIKHREEIKEYKKMRLRDVPDERDKKNFREKRRRIRKKNNGGTHTFKEWKDLKKRYNYTCPICGRKEPEIKLTEDHVISLSLGGRDDIGNIQPLCISCNIWKYQHCKVRDLRPDPFVMDCFRKFIINSLE